MIAVVDYRKGNLMSVERGLEAAGAEAVITDDPAVIAQADAVVLPGVGAFADAMSTMNELGQADAVREAIAAAKPFLGICLGMHLLFEAGTESVDGALMEGLGIIPGVVERMPNEDAAGKTYKIPHVGWNTVEPLGPLALTGQAEDAFAAGSFAVIEAYQQGFDDPLFAGIEPGEHFYFTHSFIAPESDATIATTTHSVTFPCALRCGERAYGVQFHPEKSSDTGAQLLRNFVELARG